MGRGTVAMDPQGQVRTCATLVAGDVGRLKGLAIRRRALDPTSRTYTRLGMSLDSISVLAIPVPEADAVVTGSFTEAMDFGFGEVNETNFVSFGGADAFVARYGATGLLTWAVRHGGTFHDEGMGIVALADGSCVTAGYFTSGAVFGLGDPNETNLLASTTEDLYVARFDRDGLLDWVSHAGGTPIFLTPSGVTPFPDGSIGVTGQFYDGTVLFGAGENLTRPISSAGGGHVFVARFNADGGF